MKTYIMTADELEITVTNGQWFAGFKCRWVQLGLDRFSVITNYVPAGVK